jgi:ADP-ribosyl-[dinitrogen reductase] hydrolase
MRTSVSHPLKIADVSGGADLGRIRLTLCPGKDDPYGMSGAWDRDLSLDLDQIQDWGAVALVTLLEPDD